MKLSIVDQSPVSAGSNPAEALQNSIELARLADKLGYQRYWVSEHHGMEVLAGSAPEILIARIAAETSRIRVGSGAVLLPHYSALKVAEQFRLLHALYPDRIDLGVGRAPGGTHLAGRALRRGQLGEHDDFPEKLWELRAFLDKEFEPQHPYREMLVTPEMPGSPTIWLVGSSLWSASVAAHLGLPYAFAHFIDPQPTRDAVAQYRNEFKPSQHLKTPKLLVALGAICAETNEAAERLAASPRALLRRFRTMPRAAGLVPRVEDASKELSVGLDPAVFDTGEWNRYTVGDPEAVHKQLSTIARELNADELMIVTIVHDHQARLRSYKLLAQAFGLDQLTCY